MQMTNRPPVNPSALSEGRHPGFLLHIAEESTPDDWLMAKQSPTMWRWYFALWEVPTLIPQHAPELQTAITSTKFAPKGKFQASKAYTWTCQILGRHIAPGESVNYDTLYPLPCSVKVTREPGKDYIKIVDVEGWPEGATLLTDAFKEALREVLAQPPTSAVAASTQAAAPTPAPQPGMQSWGNPALSSAPATPSVSTATPTPTGTLKW